MKAAVDVVALLRAQADALSMQARTLRAQADALDVQARTLRAQADALDVQARTLRAQADALDVQARTLRAQADALEAGGVIAQRLAGISLGLWISIIFFGRFIMYWPPI